MPISISFLLFYLGSELVAYFVFRRVRKHYLGEYGSTRPMWNGIIERVFLYLCILTQVYHGLTLFGALKIGTRIKADENKVSNDWKYDFGKYGLGDHLLLSKLDSINE